MEATLMGVKNRTDKEQIFMFDGKHVVFKPGEVRLLQQEAGIHAEKQLYVRQPRGADGKLENRLVGERPFEIIPLEEAVKVATIEEAPQLVRARAKLEAQAKERAALTEEVIAGLKKAGWKAPGKAKEAGE